MELKVINGNNIDILKTYPDNYFDAVVTDPPYGLGKEPNAQELMKDWIEHGYHEISGKGFMGKEWDAFVPQPIFWKEIFRVLKPGGHVLSFFGTRTYDWGVMSMRFAGFEVRDCIQWLYGSGFPKSHNIALALDKKDGIIGNRGKAINVGGKGDRKDIETSVSNLNGTLKPAYKSKNNWDGWGTALKPANEPIVLARKPLEKGLSIAENILKWGVGGINIDASRIGVSKNDTNHRHNPSKGNEGQNSIFGIGGHNGNLNSQGRFPANIILTHHEDCECKGTKKVKGQKDKPTNRTKFEGTWNEGNSGLRNNTNSSKEGYADKEGNETIEDWDCHEDCPIRILDEQSLSMGMHSAGNKRQKNVISEYDSSSYHAPKERQMNRFGDKGGASRFFYVAKASKSERNKGLDGFEEKSVGTLNSNSSDLENYGGMSLGGASLKGEHKNPIPKANFHPTVKPIKLMQYLVKMITPPNGIVLDPFCGSGTTGVACKIDGFSFIGLEQDPEYTKIAQARINNYKDDTINKKEDNEQKDQLTLF